MKLKGLIVGLALVLGVSGCAGERRGVDLESGKLQTSIVGTDQLCFNTEEFRGIEKYYVDRIKLCRQNIEYNRNDKEECLQSHKTIRLSQIAGRGNCITYASVFDGDQLLKFIQTPDISKQYRFTVWATEDNYPTQNNPQHYGGRKLFESTFAFEKNAKTGNYKVLLLKSN